nr:reverse transcriptase domain-containing protein [Tanacetum cinerariifolium]
MSQPTSVVRNTLGKEQVPQNLGGFISDEALREYCDKNYHRILPIIAEKVHQEKVQQEKLKAVKARLNFEESSWHSESGTPSRMRDLKERLRPRHARSRSKSPEPRCGRSKSPKERGPERRTAFKRLEKGVFHRLGDRKRVCPHTREIQSIGHPTVAAGILKATTRALAPEEQSSLLRNIVTKGCPYETRKRCQKVKATQEEIGSQDQIGKSRVWRMTSPNPGVWFDDLPKESIDSYNDLTTRGNTALDQVEKIRSLEKDLEPRTQQLVVAEEKVGVLEGKNWIYWEDLAYVGLRIKLHSSYLRPEIWILRGRSHGRPNTELFTMSYPDVQKVADSCDLPMNELLAVYPDVPSPPVTEGLTSGAAVDDAAQQPSASASKISTDVPFGFTTRSSMYTFHEC